MIFSMRFPSLINVIFRISKKKPNRYEKHMKRFLDAKRMKNMKAMSQISIEGRKMAL